MSIRQPKRQAGSSRRNVDRLEKLLARDLDGELAKRDAAGDQRRPEAIREISVELVKGFVHQASWT